MKLPFRAALFPLPALLALILALPGAPPAPDPGAGQDKPLEHRVSVSVKLVQVYVTGKGGAPVTDLTAADFEIVDNGRTYPVTHFEKHVIGTGGSGVGPGPAPGAGVAATMSRKFLLVFDLALTDPKDLGRARETALELLDGRLRPSDEIGVVSYSVGRGLVIHEYFTADHARVRSVVEGIGGRPRAGRAESLTRQIYAADLAAAPGTKSAPAAGLDPESRFYEDQALLQAGQGFGSAADFSYVDLAERYLTALGQLARVLRDVPGFKNIVLFSGGVAGRYLYGRRGGAAVGEWTTAEELAAQLKDYDAAQASATVRDAHVAMIREFEAANCPVYTVDVSRERNEGDVLGARGGADPAGRELEGADSLRQLAGGTGGKFYARTVRDERVAEDIRTSTAAYYVLGYEVGETYDGAFHRIGVKVGRKGVDVKTQGGYFGAKPFKDFTRFEKLLHVVDAALSDAPLAEVPFDVPVAGLPLVVGDSPRLLVFARASPNDLAEVLGRKSEAYLLLMDERGDVVSTKRFPISVEEPRRGALYPSFLVPVEPGAYTCRMVLRNLETGRAARGAAPVTVPPERAPGLGLDPPLLLVPEKGTETLPDSPDSAPDRLFGYDPAAYAPRAGDVAPGTARLHAAVRVDAGGATAKDLVLRAFIAAEAGPARSEAPVTVLDRSGDGPIRLLFVEIATGELRPGRYTLELEVGKTATGESAARAAAFTVR